MKVCPFCAESVQDAAIVCKHCTRTLPTPPVRTLTPDEQRRVTRTNRVMLATGAVLALIALVMVISAAVEPSALPSSAQGDDLAQLVDRVGQPDHDTSSEDEVPRPPFVTRILTFTPEHVRVVYRANVQMGAPPPYTGTWTLVGYADTMTNQRLEAAVARRRLATRARLAR